MVGTSRCDARVSQLARYAAVQVMAEKLAHPIIL